MKATIMTDETPQPISAGNIAKELGISDSKVKKAIAELGLQPAKKRGACCLYDREAIERIKSLIR